MELTPSVSWSVGDQRVTTTGTALEGVQRETYWTGRTGEDTDLELEEALSRSLSSLRRKETFLRNFKASGGRIEYFVGVFPDMNCGVILRHSLLLKLGKLGIDLAFDIYGAEQDG